MADPESIQHVHGAGIAENSATDSGTPLGTKRTANGKTYRRVQVKTGITIAANDVCYHDGANIWTITNVLTSIGRNHIAGVAQNALTALFFGYIQTGGAATPKKGTGASSGFAVSDTAVASATAPECEKVAADTAPTHRILGFATATSADGDPTTAIEMTMD